VGLVKPDGELTILTFKVPAETVIRWLAEGGDGDPRLAQHGTLTEAGVAEDDEHGQVLELEFVLDRE
jgi:hypothetical protein